MAWFNSFVLFVMIWWTALFAVLPFATRPVADADPATGWRGAPERPRLLMKLVATTVISVLIWAACMLLIRSDWFSFRTGWLALPPR